MVDYYSKVVERLGSLNLIISPEDTLRIKHLISKVDGYTRTICNFTETEDLPTLITPAFVDEVVGEFLHEKVKSGLLDVEAARKTIKEGDTSITYAYGDGSVAPEARLDSLVKGIENHYRTVIMRYRKISW